MITTGISGELREIVDARLDYVERALMSKGMGRGERREILAAIEDQILVMLGNIDGDEPTRDDLLRVLAQLDPPEAYLELGNGEGSRTASQRLSAAGVSTAGYDLPASRSFENAARRSAAAVKFGEPQVMPADYRSDLPVAAAGAINVLAVISFILLCFAFASAFFWWEFEHLGLLAFWVVTMAAGICGTLSLCQFVSGPQNHRGMWMAVVATSCAPAIGALSMFVIVMLGIL